MNMLFKLISLSLTLCLCDKLTLHAANLSEESLPLLAEYNNSTQQRTAASVTPIIGACSQIPEHLEHAHLSLEGVVLFDDPASYKIKARTLSNWSHAGLWVRDTRHHRDDRNGWYILESVINSSLGEASTTAEVRLVPWKDNIRSSDDITLRHFHYQNGEMPSSCALKHVINKYIGRPYEQNLSGFAGGTLGVNATSYHSISCSELNALVLQDLGFLSKTKVASNFVPAHFSLERKPSALPLIDAHLGREHVIQRAPRSGFRKAFESATRVLRFCASKVGLI